MPGKKASSVRIIGGQWRGRKLPVLERDGLRPTKDQVRETLFNWVSPMLNGARCLDLFAGTGALGFEAASRGAGRVVLVEKDRQVARQLEQNRDLLNASTLDIQCQAASQFLSMQPIKPFDLVFLDPPFHEGLLAKVLEQLCATEGLLSEEAEIYIEEDAAKGLPALPSPWHYRREKKMGQVVYALASRA